jgi:hypothetical protein
MSKAAELAKWGEVSTNGQVSGRRNIVINGAMQVDQRGATVTASGYSVDRFTITKTAMDELVIAVTQDTDTPSEFTTALKLAVTTEESAPQAVDELLDIRHIIEAQNLQHLEFGTATAKKLTLSFWVRSSTTGKYSLLFLLDDDTRSNLQSYTISTANTWEYKTITIDGDTTGVIDNNSGIGMSIIWTLSAGTNFTGTPHAGWGAYSETEDHAHSDMVDFAAVDDGTFHITGVQLEVGSVATPFEHRSFGEELELCKRYYQSIGDRENNHTLPLFDTAAQDATDSTSTFHFFPPMRATPTLETTGTAADYKIYTNNTNIALASVPSFGSGSTQCGFLSAAVGSGLTAGEVCHVTGNTDPAFVAFRAEL